MIGMLLFISAANLAVSIFIKPPEWRDDGNVYFTRYTTLSFRLTMFFGLLALLF